MGEATEAPAINVEHFTAPGLAIRAKAETVKDKRKKKGPVTPCSAAAARAWAW